MIDRLVHHARSSHSKETATASKTETSAASPPSRPTNNEPRLVKIHLPTTDQDSVAVDASSTCASGIDRERNTGTGDVERFATSEAAGSIDANYWW
jgi:hypothetical protein